MCTTSGGGGSASSWAGRMRLNNESIMRSVCFISTQHTCIHNSQIHTIYKFNCFYNWVPIDMWMLRGLSPQCTSPRTHSIPAITIRFFLLYAMRDQFCWKTNLNTNLDADSFTCHSFTDPITKGVGMHNGMEWPKLKIKFSDLYMHWKKIISFDLVPLKVHYLFG